MEYNLFNVEWVRLICSAKNLQRSKTVNDTIDLKTSLFVVVLDKLNEYTVPQKSKILGFSNPKKIE